MPRRPDPRLLLAAAAGLALDGAFAPVDQPLLAPVAVAGLLLAVRGATLREGALRGGTFALGCFLPMLHWAGSAAGPLGWLALVALQCVLTLPVGAALALVGRHRAWPLWSVAVLVAGEALRARVPFGGFPWGRLGLSQADGPLTGWVAVGGVPLLSAAVALCGAAFAVLALSLRRPPARRRATVLLVGGAVAVTLAGPLLPRPTGGEALRVAVVQGNVPRLGLPAADQRAAVLRNHVAVTRELASDVRAGRLAAPDLVVWPENASDLDPFASREAYDLIDGAVRDVGVPVIVGALVATDDGRLDNTGIVWDPVTGPGERYVKRHPVPFGEYIPYRSLVRRLTDKVDLVPRDFRPGTRIGTLDVAGTRVADVICFEVAYDDLVRDTVRAGGRLVVVQTNNATFGRSAETEQQLAMGRLRAVEHGRTVLVSATSGVSAVVAPDGSVQQRLEVFTRGVLVQEVPLRDGRTLATRLGGWPEAMLCLLALAGCGVAARAREGQGVAE